MENNVTAYQQIIFDLVKQIPRGKVTTYQLLALKLGNKNDARAVGNALNKNQNIPEVPCHRVVRTNGSIGGYALGSKKKCEILMKEGIPIIKGYIPNFEKYLYDFQK